MGRDYNPGDFGVITAPVPLTDKENFTDTPTVLGVPVGGGGGGTLPYAWPRRASLKRWANDNGWGFITGAMVASRQYFVPFVPPRNIALTAIIQNITVASAGTCSLGIYANGTVSGEDGPTSLLTSVTGIDTGLVGDVSAPLPFTLNAGTLYWLSAIFSATPTVNAPSYSGSIGAFLGHITSVGGYINGLYAAGVGTTLPDPAPTILTDSNVAYPGFQLVEF